MLKTPTETTPITAGQRTANSCPLGNLLINRDTLICGSEYFVSGVRNWLQDGQQRERGRGFSA